MSRTYRFNFCITQHSLLDTRSAPLVDVTRPVGYTLFCCFRRTAALRRTILTRDSAVEPQVYT